MGHCMLEAPIAMYKHLQDECLSIGAAMKRETLQQALKEEIDSMKDAKGVASFVGTLQRCGDAGLDAHAEMKQGCDKALSTLALHIMAPEQPVCISDVAKKLGQGASRIGIATESISRKVTAVAAHAEMSEAAASVQSYAFEASDKDDVVSRKMVGTWKHCNVLTASLAADFNEACVRVLTEAKDHGWSILAGIVRHKQNKVDAVIVERANTLRPKAGGADDGLSWKEGLQNASLSEVEKKCGVLWQDKSKGTELQQGYKKLLQACAWEKHREQQKKNQALQSCLFPTP